MRLTKINYGSAVFFGVVALILNLINGIQLWIGRETLTAAGQQVVPLQALVVIPLVGGIGTYITSILIILIYNFLAKKLPISWEIKK